MKRLLYPIAAVIVLTAACKRGPFEVRPGSLNWLTEQRVGADGSEVTVTQNRYDGADVE